MNRRKPNILIVDDDQPLGDALSRDLRDAFDVHVEHEAPDACQRLAIGERFSVVLVDLGLPGMNGMDLFHWMSGACPDQADRVLFITGSTPEPTFRSFLDSHATRVVPKPFNRTELVSRIENVLTGG